MLFKFLTQQLHRKSNFIFFIFYSCKSYDGSTGYGSVNEPPIGGRHFQAPPLSSASSSVASRYSCNNSNSSTNNNSSNESSGIHWRTSSAGAADLRAPSHNNRTQHQQNQQNKMADLNITRGHSPNFSPSRNNCKLIYLLNYILYYH